MKGSWYIRRDVVCVEQGVLSRALSLPALHLPWFWANVPDMQHSIYIPYRKNVSLNQAPNPHSLCALLFDGSEARPGHPCLQS